MDDSIHDTCIANTAFVVSELETGFRDFEQKPHKNKTIRDFVPPFSTHSTTNAFEYRMQNQFEQKTKLSLSARDNKRNICDLGREPVRV